MTKREEELVEALRLALPAIRWAVVDTEANPEDGSHKDFMYALKMATAALAKRARR